MPRGPVLLALNSLMHNEDVSKPRVFSEQEVTQILRRAVELSEEGSASAYTPGVTREELERIAREVGVSTEALRRAIDEAAQRPSVRGPLHLTEEFERVVSGELDPSQFDLVIEGIKPLSNSGQPSASQIGRTLTMSAWTGTGQAKVEVTSRGGRTRLKVRSNAFFQALMTLYPAAIGSMIAMGAFSERGMAWLGAAVSLGLLAVGTTIFRALTKTGHRKAEEMADTLRDRIARSVDANAVEAGNQTEEEASVQQRLGLS